MTTFDLVPVIDLMGGKVVHARAGERDRYRPLEGSRLCASAEPEAVVAGLLAFHPFRRIYVADLDAIRGQGDHRAAIRALAGAFPEVSLWVDAAFAGACACRRFLDAGLGELVLGSESQADLTMVELLQGEERWVLSLDYRGDEPLGPPALFARPDLWPKRVIAMTLARVGLGAGPDIERLRAIRSTAPDRRLYAAGGVRGPDDLLALRELGCAGALVASALHDGRLDRAALERLDERQGPVSRPH